MKRIVMISALALLAGCANQIGTAGVKAIGEVQRFNDITGMAAVHGPCIISLGTLTQLYSPAEEQMILQWGHTFCQRLPDVAPSALPALPIPPVVP